eukprot:14924470-Alexandrium_andersonii.AAC.1
MSVISASPKPTLPSISSGRPTATAKSNTATPRSILPCACREIGRPSRACWAATPGRIAVQSAGG